jgi:hypothetical protein
MRIPVFSRRSNPSIDPPILRKSVSYAQDQVKFGRAFWVDDNDPGKGIICRTFLDSAKPLPVDTEPSGPPVELGLRFIPPRTWKNPTLPRLAIYSLAAAAPGWNYDGLTA